MKKIIAFCLITFSIVSCSKYEDGGYNLFSSRQYKNVIGEWAVEKRFINDVEVPFESSITNYRLLFDKEGNYKESYLKNGVEQTTEGVWNKRSGTSDGYIISTDKGNIIFTVTRSKRNEIWFNYISLDTKKYEYHLINARKAND